MDCQDPKEDGVAATLLIPLPINNKGGVAKLNSY